jgi:hypothetical protein
VRFQYGVILSDRSSSAIRPANFGYDNNAEMTRLMISLLFGAVTALHAQSAAQASEATANRAVAKLMRSGRSAAHLDCAQAIIDQHNNAYKAYPETLIAGIADIREELYGKPTAQQKLAAKACAQRTLTVVKAEESHTPSK